MLTYYEVAKKNAPAFCEAMENLGLSFCPDADDGDFYSHGNDNGLGLEVCCLPKVSTDDGSSRVSLWSDNDCYYTLLEEEKGRTQNLYELWHLVAEIRCAKSNK